MKLKIGARRHEANEWLTSSKIPQFQCQVFSTADAHIAYWCHNSKSSECRDLYTGLSPMSSASSPDRGRCVPKTSQTVRSLWKRALPSWSVRFAYTAWIKGLSFLPFHGTVGLRTFLRFGCLNVLGPISPNDFHSMMTSSNGNIFRVTGPLCGEFTCHRWIPLTKASDMELWCFLRSATEQTFKQTIKTPVIWDAIELIMTSL